MTDHSHAHEHHQHVSYEEAVRRYRADKDAAYRSLPESPIPRAHRASFTGLPYFDVNRGLVVDGGEEEGSLFVPFLDGTSGRETYGAGRYLDLAPEDDGTWTLDFNLAYHPSCVYDPEYSCPLTPAENRLPIRIEAGERLPSEH